MWRSMKILVIIIFIHTLNAKACTIFGSTIYCQDLCEYPPLHFYREMEYIHVGEAYDDDNKAVDLRCLMYFPNATVIINFIIRK